MRGSGDGRLSASLCQNPRERLKSSILLPVSQPYQPHTEYRPPYAMPGAPAKRRPSVAWFVLGGLLLLAAALVFAITIARFTSTVIHTDAVFRASGTHAVTLPAGTERGLYVPEGRPIPQCQVTDGARSALHFRHPDARFTYDGWLAVRVFDTGDGNITFTCAPGVSGRMRIAQVPSGDDFARLGFVGVLLPMALGGLGFLVVLVTGVLFYTRRPRTELSPYAVAPGPAYGGAPGYPQAYPPTYPSTYPAAYSPTDQQPGPPTAPPTGAPRADAPPPDQGGDPSSGSPPAPG
jgi:hypothetical protein